MNNSKTRTSFNNNLIKLRKERGFTQETLAKISGIPRHLIAYYETKPVKPPIDKVEKLATALNVNIDKLVNPHLNNTKNKNELLNLDSRTINKIKLILSLDKNDRHLVYSYADSLAKKKKEKQLQNSKP